MSNTETRIEKAARELAKALRRIGKEDPAMEDRLSKLLGREMEAVREGR